MGVGLPPCPFCGNEHPDIVSGDSVYCDQCWASVPFDSWNRRTPGLATAKLLDKLLDYRQAPDFAGCISVTLWMTGPEAAAFIAEHEPTKDDAKDDAPSSGQ